MKLSENNVEELKKLGEILDSTYDYNAQILILNKLRNKLEELFTLNETIKYSTYNYMEDFIQNIIRALEHEEFYVAFVYLERFMHHHRPSLKNLQWYQLGDLSQFFNDTLDNS